MTRNAGRWKIAVFLCGLVWLSRPSLAAECRNQIDILGGSTAILRNVDLETVEKLQKVMERDKYRKAFEQTLEKAGLKDRWPEVLDKIKAMTPQDLVHRPPGTQFEWMAFRHKSDRTIGLLKHSCWEGKEDLRAWRFTLEVDGWTREFLIPVKCLNLTLVKEPVPGPPSCTLDANVDCEKSQIKITAKARADEKATITGVTLTSKPEIEVKGPKVEDGIYEWTVEKASGNYQLSAVATDSLKQESPACTVKVALCQAPPPPPPCKPPSCSLKVTGDWPKGAKEGSLTITIGEGTVAGRTVKLDGKELTPDQLKQPVPISTPGNYTVEVVARSSDTRCDDSTCAATVHVVPPPPCCESPWLFRAFGSFAEAQGSEVSGSHTTPDGKTGPYKFDFNQGLGFGLELERLLTRGGTWDEADLGWTLELLRVNLDTVWVFDPHPLWIMDDDRVPMTALTTGINYHVRQPNWDFFVGPRIGFVRFEDGTYADGTMMPGTFKASFDDSFAFGANLGFDALLGECWGLTGGLEYLKVSTEADFLDIDVDPLIVKVGFVYHF